MKEELYPRYIETPAKYIYHPGLRPEMCGLWARTERIKKSKRLAEAQCDGALPGFSKN